MRFARKNLGMYKRLLKSVISHNETQTDIHGPVPKCMKTSGVRLLLTVGAVACCVGCLMSQFQTFDYIHYISTKQVRQLSKALPLSPDHTLNLRNCPRVALLFLTRQGLQQRDIWEQWLELAYNEEQVLGDFAVPKFVDLLKYSDDSRDLLQKAATLTKKHEMLCPKFCTIRGCDSQEPMYEFSNPPKRCGNIPERASVYSMMVSSHNLSHAKMIRPIAFPNAPFNCSLVSPPPTKYLASNSAQLRLYAEALKDSRNAYFVVISESTIPVRSFGDFYDYLLLSNRSQFEPMSVTYSNVAFKHSQWTVLNRRHVEILLKDKQNISSMGTLYYRGRFAGEEEIRPALVLGLELGSRQFWKEVNDGEDLSSFFTRNRRIEVPFRYNMLERPIPMEVFSKRPTAAFWWEIKTVPNTVMYPFGLDLTPLEPKIINGMNETRFFEWLGEQPQMISMMRKVKENAYCINRQGKNVSMSECIIDRLSQVQMIRNRNGQSLIRMYS